MSVRAFTSLKPARSADAGRIETLFARQREATERYRARFTLKDRLDSLSRLKGKAPGALIDQQSR
jgi:hypothetical protein